MARHKKSKPPIDWGQGKRWVKAVTPWVELLVTVTTLILLMIGKG